MIYTTDWSLNKVLPEVALSIELFPPKSPAGNLDLRQALGELNRCSPELYTVTSGAGGTANTQSLETIEKVRQQTGIPVAAHLTCVGRSKADIELIAEKYWQAGINQIVALRGDRPNLASTADCNANGYSYASDLVFDLMRLHPFDISVAGYPETHPEASSAALGLDHLAMKVDAGAARVIGQYCFDTDAILRFRDQLAGRGIKVPFVPGIMPIHDFRQIRKFSKQCGASIPHWLEELFDNVEPATPLHQMIAASVAAEQCRRLAAEGFDHLHIYALNRAELTIAIACLLGRLETPALAA